MKKWFGSSTSGDFLLTPERSRSAQHLELTALTVRISVVINLYRVFLLSSLGLCFW